VPGLLDKRLVFVTGKGGVGRSSVASALAIVAARRGRRTIVVEVAHQERIARAFGGPDSHFREAQLAPGLFTISIDPRAALEEYLRMQLKVGALADLLSSSRMFTYFTAATPGMTELVTMGKIWELAQRPRRAPGADPYDVVVVDAPATGHGLAIMHSTRTFADIARVGPVAHHGNIIHADVVDPGHTGVVAVALAEEMPVNETLWLRDRLHEQLGLSLDRVIVNALLPERFTPRDAGALGRALESAGTPLQRAALRAALSEHVRARGQREQLSRLEEAMGAEPVRLPFVFEPADGAAAFEPLAERLEEAL
jgi:anion-transporting  ArsA/GET3 family ATPase